MILKYLSLFTITFVLFSCVESPEPGALSFGEKEDILESDNQKRLFEHSYQAMNSCFSCHTSGYRYGDFQKLKSDQDWADAGLIVPGDPDNSLLVKKLRPSKSPIATMPPSGDFSKENYEAIRKWIQTMGATSKEPTPPNTDSPKILGLSLVRSSTGDFISVLQNGEEVSLSQYSGGLSIKAEVEGFVDYIQFDSVISYTDDVPPFYACGDSSSIVQNCGFSAGALPIKVKAYKNEKLVDTYELSLSFTNGDNGGSPAPPPSSSAFEQAYNKMSTCFTCHNSASEYGNLERLKTEADWVKLGLVVPGAPDDSLLIKKLRHSKSSIATMPPANDFSFNDYEYIRAWISKIEKTPSGPTTPTSPSSVDDKFVSSPTVFGIEQFLSQMKKFYFIPGSDNRTFYALANNWRPFWGGGCDFYESAIEGLKSSYQLIWERPTRVCDYDAEQSGPIGNLSIIKAGSRINICEYFSNSNKNMEAFYSKNIISGRSFNKENAEKAFSQYYPTLSFTDEIYNSFLNSANAKHSGIESNEDLLWRLYLSTLCQSLGWEAL